jgi:hypothetical protein
MDAALTCSKVGGGEASGMWSASCGGSSKGSSRMMVCRMLQGGTGQDGRGYRVGRAQAEEGTV